MARTNGGRTYRLWRDGEEPVLVTNLAAWGRANGIIHQGFYPVLRGERRSFKGWQATYADNRPASQRPHRRIGFEGPTCLKCEAPLTAGAGGNWWPSMERACHYACHDCHRRKVTISKALRKAA